MKSKKYNRICILDTETTDKYWNCAAPVQLAAMICDGEGNIIDQFDERIKTNHQINPEASAVHGIYDKDLIDCRKESVVLQDFCAWLIGADIDVILTYNGEAFDRPMLNMRCEKLGVKTDFFNKEKFPGIDGYYNCVKIAKDKNMGGLKDFLGRKWRLGLVANFYNIDDEGAHDAYEDVRMLKEIYFLVDPMVHPEDWE